MYSTGYSCRIVMKPDFFPKDFRRILKQKKNCENPFSGSRVLYGRTDITKLIVTFLSFSKAPKNYCIILVLVVIILILRMP